MSTSHAPSAIRRGAKLVLLVAIACTASSSVLATGYVASGDGPVRTGLGECLRSGSETTGVPCDSSAVRGARDGEARHGTASPIDSEAVVRTRPARRPAARPAPSVTEILTAYVLFDSNEAELRPDGADVLREILFVLEREPWWQVTAIEVIGHADASASRDYNHALSLERAATVAAFFRAAYPGVPVAAIGLGELEPVASNETAVGRQANRRAELRMLVSKPAARPGANAYR